MGRGFLLHRGGLQLLNTTAFTRFVPGVPVPNLPFIGAYALRVDSLIATANMLRANAMSFEQRDSMLFVAFPRALGQGAWIFVEQASDLPWRAKS
jgi:hypothetical protein